MPDKSNGSFWLDLKCMWFWIGLSGWCFTPFIVSSIYILPIYLQFLSLAICIFLRSYSTYCMGFLIIIFCCSCWYSWLFFFFEISWTSEDRSSGSVSSGGRGSDADMDHCLLTIPNGDVTFLAEKPVKLTPESPWFIFFALLVLVCVACMYVF